MLKSEAARHAGDFLLTAEIAFALADALGAPPPIARTLRMGPRGRARTHVPVFACAGCKRVLMLPEREALQRVGSIVHAEDDDEMLCSECACA